MTYVPTPSFLVLPDGVPVRVKVVQAQEVEKVITDAETRQPKVERPLVLKISQVNGVDRATELDLLSFKAKQLLAPFINSGQLFTRTLEITRRGSGRRTEYEVWLT